MDINPEELTRACDVAGLDASAVHGATLLKGSYRNANVKVTSAGAEYVVRFYRDRIMARKETAVHALIRGSVPVPELFYDGCGEDWEGPAFTVFRFVPGPLLEHLVSGTDEQAAAEAGESAGDVLAVIHAYTFPGSGFLDDNLIPTGSPTAEAEGVLAYVHQRLFGGAGAAAFGVAQRDELWNILRRDSRLLNQVGPEISLVHCDFNPKNIIMHLALERWSVAAVLDWEFAFAGSPIWDAANMLRYPAQYDPAFTTAFCSAFAGSHPGLADDWQQIGRMMDTVNLAEFLAQGPDNPFYEKSRDVLLEVVRRGTV